MNNNLKRGEMLSELKDSVFGNSDEVIVSQTDTGQTIPDDQITFDEVFSPEISGIDTETEEPQPSPEDLIRDSMSAVEKMRLEIAAENEDLDKRFAQAKAEKIASPAVKKRPTYMIGVLSSAVSLIFMGITVTAALLSSPVGIFAALKLSPVMLIFLGAEILFAVFRKHSLKIKIDLRSIIIIVSLMLISFVLSIVSTAASSGNGERVYAEQRIQNMLANELHDTIAEDYIRNVRIETQLYAENAEIYVTPADLTNGDIINLTINFSDANMTIRQFAVNCRKIIVNLHKLSYNFGTIVFVADDMINHYVLNIDWHYQSDFSADKLAGLVNYFGDSISDSDIPDIIDEDDLTEDDS